MSLWLISSRHLGYNKDMLYLLVGENVFQRDEAVAKIINDRAFERVEGESITPERLGEVMAGQTLFDGDVVKVIDNASVNAATWASISDWVERGVSSDIILTEQKVDKRTKTYKILKDNAKIIECDFWTDRQKPKAISWLKAYAREQGVDVPTDLYDEMIERATRPSDVSKDAVIDQQRLARAVKQLKHAEKINREILDTVLAPLAHENAFGLLASTLEGDIDRVRETLHNLRRDQDGHRLLGLLSSQIASLVGLILGKDRSIDAVAKDIGAHPYALQQLARYRQQISRNEVSRIVDLMADADLRLKNSQADPWVLIEKALVEIAVNRKTSRA